MTESTSSFPAMDARRTKVAAALFFVAAVCFFAIGAVRASPVFVAIGASNLTVGWLWSRRGRVAGER